MCMRCVKALETVLTIVLEIVSTGHFALPTRESVIGHLLNKQGLCPDNGLSLDILCPITCQYRNTTMKHLLYYVNKYNNYLIHP